MFASFCPPVLISRSFPQFFFSSTSFFSFSYKYHADSFTLLEIIVCSKHHRIFIPSFLYLEKLFLLPCSSSFVAFTCFSTHVLTKARLLPVDLLPPTINPWCPYSPLSSSLLGSSPPTSSSMIPRRMPKSVGDVSRSYLPTPTPLILPARMKRKDMVFYEELRGKFKLSPLIHLQPQTHIHLDLRRHFRLLLRYLSRSHLEGDHRE